MSEQRSSPAPADRSIVLALGDRESLLDVFLAPDWKPLWSEVWREPLDALEARERPFVRVAPDRSLPEVDGGRLTLWICGLDQLRAATADTSWQRIIFAPSQLSVLDAMSAARPSLAARRALPAGHSLGEDDLAVAIGPPGIPASARTSCIGRTLCYDVEAGEILTFGFLR